LLLVLFWIYHNKLHEKIDFYRGMIEICKRHKARESGEWTRFADIGAEYIDRDHKYSADLDIVGKKSLFQWINTTHTWHGRKRLSNDLLHSDYTQAEILRRQEAVRELSCDASRQCVMEFGFTKIGINKKTPELVQSLGDKRAFFGRGRYFVFVLPVLTLVSAVISIVLQNHLYVAIMSVVQCLMWLRYSVKTADYLEAVVKLPYRLAAYNEMIQKILEHKYESQCLILIQNRLRGSVVAMKQLERIASAVNLRHNSILWGMLNIALLWAIFTSLRYEAWKREFSHLAEDWFEAMGEYEALLAFSILPNVCSTVCLPTPGEYIIAKSLGHPLIANEARVENDLNLQDGIFIISGSNMSGKTTFLRTVGINIVLARAGSYVCAEEMQFPMINVLTSMRIADDLNEGISTFYAELQRIKMIIESAGNSSLFLIDEIFRGTNSVDRLAGAKAVLSKLDKLGATGIITTHDLDLCDIADTNSRIKNYGFCETFEGDKICFDYKMRPGKSISTNAKYLMRIIGIEA